MRKIDVITKISSKTGISKVNVIVAVEAFLKEVQYSLKNGEHVFIRGFGTFLLKKRAKKTGRNIKKNEAIEIPEHYIPAFKPSKRFAAIVKENNQVKINKRAAVINKTNEFEKLNE
jgi:DNA-binding protein HU-beta